MHSFFIFNSFVQALALSSNLYPNSKVLSQECTLYWQDHDTFMRLALECQATGWIAMGISATGGMKGADIYMGRIDSNNMAELQDYYAQDQARPILDTVQDVRDIAVTRSDGKTLIEFTRDIDTCDSQDLPLKDSVKIIYAFSNSDDFGYHGMNRGTATVVFRQKSFKSVREVDAVPLDFTVGQNVLFSIPEFPNGGNIIETLDIDTISTLNTTNYNKQVSFRGNNYSIGFGGGLDNTLGRHGLGTTYWCKLITFNASVKHHVIEFEPIITPGNEKNLHHILLHSCSASLSLSEYEGFCASPVMPPQLFECYQNAIIMAWGIGAGSFKFPQKVGYPIGGASDVRFALMEIHYDNQDPKRSFTDQSGLRLWTTQTYREHEAGLLMVGYKVSKQLLIPPLQDAYLKEAFCHGDCTSQALGHNITIFAGALHMHTAGLSGSIQHYRKGVQQPHMHAIRSYDFDLQLTEPISPPVVFAPGDDIVVQCMMGTKHRLYETVGGLSTKQEMCLGFLYYYPKSDLALCTSEQRTGSSWNNICDSTANRTKTTVEFPSRTQCLESTSSIACSTGEEERSSENCPNAPEPWDYSTEQIARSDLIRTSANTLTFACDSPDEIPTQCISMECRQAVNEYVDLIKGDRYEIQLSKAISPLAADCIETIDPKTNDVLRLTISVSVLIFCSFVTSN